MSSCFSSDLGTRRSVQNISSGTHRYKFFSTAVSNRKRALTFRKQNSRRPDSSSTAIQEQRPNEPPRIYHESGTQTEQVRPIMSSLSSTFTVNEKVQSEPPLSEIQLEKIARKKERREQEAALPPVTGKKSLEAYRVFLEENETKDFVLREKELDHQLNERMKEIERNLYTRYEKSNSSNQGKVELIRKTKMESLKKKRNHQLDCGNLSDMSNKPMQPKRERTFSSNAESKFAAEAKQHKRPLVKVKLYQKKKVKEDLALITSSFDRK